MLLLKRLVGCLLETLSEAVPPGLCLLVLLGFSDPTQQGFVCRCGCTGTKSGIHAGFVDVAEETDMILGTYRWLKRV
jgi:hypothetical protein